MSIIYKPILAFVTICVLFLSGCAGKVISPIPYDASALVHQEEVIGIVSTRLPDTDMIYPGASCLLCLGAAAAMNSTLSSYAETLDASELEGIKKEIAESLEAQGKNVKLINYPLDVKVLKDFSSEAPNTALKDYTTYAKQAGVQHLVVIDFSYLGFQRNYASYIPSSDPFAKVVGKTLFVDGENNTLYWYLPLDIEVSSQGEWDEPEDFPGLTNAFYQALAIAKEQIVTPINSSLAADQAAEFQSDPSDVVALSQE